MKSIRSGAGVLLISAIFGGGAISLARPAEKDAPEARDPLRVLNESLSRIVTLLEQNSKRETGDTRLRELQVLTTIAQTREASIRSLEGQIWSIDQSIDSAEESVKSSETEIKLLSERGSSDQTPKAKSESVDRKRRYERYVEINKAQLARYQDKKLELQAQLSERRRAITQLNAEIEQQLYRLLEDLGK